MSCGEFIAQVNSFPRMIFSQKRLFGMKIEGEMAKYKM